MPAVIRIEIGAGAGRSYPIAEDVVRIGSGSSAGLRLADPNIPPHAVTVEFRGGQYRVHNRSSRVIRIGGKPVAANASATWGDDQQLELDDHTVLRLRITGNPAPVGYRDVPASIPDLPPPLPPPPPPPAAAGPKKSHAGQWAVIWLCAVAVALIVALEFTDEPTGPSPTAEFDTLMKDLLAVPPTPDLPSDQMRIMLQTARSAELRGQTNRARRGYGAVIELLQSRRRIQGGKVVFEGDTDKNVLRRTFDFARKRLPTPAE